jgi:transcriptional regulator with XRE-family HTH domain
VLAEQGRPYTDLWQEVARDKNTYTNWRNRRTIPRVSDLEEIAQALHVAPADLLRASTRIATPQTPEQFELPFEPGRKGARLELEYTPAGFIIRLPARSA